MLIVKLVVFIWVIFSLCVYHFYVFNTDDYKPDGYEHTASKRFSVVTPILLILLIIIVNLIS